MINKINELKDLIRNFSREQINELDFADLGYLSEGMKALDLIVNQRIKSIEGRRRYIEVSSIVATCFVDEINFKPEDMSDMSGDSSIDKNNINIKLLNLGKINGEKRSDARRRLLVNFETSVSASPSQYNLYKDVQRDGIQMSCGAAEQFANNLKELVKKNSSEVRKMLRNSANVMFFLVNDRFIFRMQEFSCPSNLRMDYNCQSSCSKCKNDSILQMIDEHELTSKFKNVVKLNKLTKEEKTKMLQEIGQMGVESIAFEKIAGFSIKELSINGLSDCGTTFFSGCPGEIRLGSSRGSDCSSDCEECYKKNIEEYIDGEE